MALTVNHLRMMPGASHGLNGPALICELDIGTDGDRCDPLPWIAACLPVMGPILSRHLGNPSALPDAAALASCIVHLASALQRHHHHPVGPGKVIAGQTASRFLLALPCCDERSVRAALAVALRLVGDGMAAAAPGVAEPDAELQAWIATQIALIRNGAPLLSVRKFLHAARATDIPWMQLSGPFYQFGYGARGQRVLATKGAFFPGEVGIVAHHIAMEKIVAMELLGKLGLPVPRQGGVAASAQHAVEIAQRIGYPVVVKPTNLSGGVGVRTNLRDEQAVRDAYAVGAACGSPVMVEQHIEGVTHRLLVAGGRLLAACRRVPASVTGDGLHTIAELVEADNVRRRREPGLYAFKLDDEAAGLLASVQLTPQSVPPVGMVVRLRCADNLHSGGTPHDVMAQVHPDNRRMAERAAHAAGLSYCGVDFITADISRSWREIGGAINEINFQPGLRSHALTHPGRQWEEEILRRMFARGGARIPIVGCSGNDAEAFSLLAQRLLSYDGMVAGTGGPWGVRIGDDIVRDACPSGFHAGQMLLADPAVEAAVVHLTADDLAACGTPFDRCDVAVLLPEADESASRVQVRRELLARARYGVLDASDPIVRECVMGPETEPLILVATHDGHPAVLAHLAAGGCAAVLEERNGATCLVLREGRSRQMMMRADRLVRSQTASSIGIERCALYAFAAAFALGIDETPTRLALERSFDLLQDVLVLHDPARGGAGI